MTIHHLVNEKYRIAVDAKGAELTSFLAHGKEYIWSGDSAWWDKSSPLLFPIIGRVPDGAYSWRGRVYKMTKHGFVRDQIFKLVQSSSNHFKFQLKPEYLSADRRSWVLENYPFDFILTITFQLRDDALHIGWEVENPGDECLPFSIGAHPALVFPFPSDRESISVDSMIMDFQRPITVERLFLNEDGLRNGLSETLIDGKSELRLNSNMFKDDCIQFRLPSSLNAVTLRNSISSGVIKLHFNGFTHFGIWTPYRRGKSSPFLCLEPWYGNDSSASDDGSFENKEGIIVLEPGAVFEAGYSLAVGNE